MDEPMLRYPNCVTKHIGVPHLGGGEMYLEKFKVLCEMHSPLWHPRVKGTRTSSNLIQFGSVWTVTSHIQKNKDAVQEEKARNIMIDLKCTILSPEQKMPTTRRY